MLGQDTEEGGTWEGKSSGGWEKAIKREIEKVPTWMACDQVSY